MNKTFGLSALKSDSAIYFVVIQTISDIDTADFAVCTLLYGQHPAQIDAIGIGDPLDHIVLDRSIDRPIIAENASVLPRPGDVVNLVIPNQERTVLRPDIDCSRIHQEFMLLSFYIK